MLVSLSSAHCRGARLRHGLNPQSQTSEAPMQKLHAFATWAESRRELWLDLVRIYLGLGLFARGLLLISGASPGFIINLLERSGQPWLITGLLLHYVTLAHLVGGA